MSTTEYLGRLASAAIAFTDVWQDSWTLSDLSGKLTMTECCALADILNVCGHVDSARGLLEAWIEAEIEDRECVEGDFVINDDCELVDTREPVEVL